MPQNHVVLVADLGYGDSGKGTVSEWLTRETGASLVVRFNGGSQCGHRVVESSGREHVFAQFGSGTFAGAKTCLSHFVVVDPWNLQAEGEALQAKGVTGIWDRILIHEQAPVATPFHWAANRLHELARGDGRHGSCGKGIGEVMQDVLAFPLQALRVGDLRDPWLLKQLLGWIQARKRLACASYRELLVDHPQAAQEFELLHDLTAVDFIADQFLALAEKVLIINDRQFKDEIAQAGTVIFEGAQGVLLDETYGFHPYTTWSTTTFANADQLLRECDFHGKVTRLGVLRAYATRHGAGPFVTEDPQLTHDLPDPKNSYDDWQGDFRVGWFDVVATCYAREVVGPLDGIALTNIDRLKPYRIWQICQEYQAGPGLTGRLYVNSPTTIQHQEQVTRSLIRWTPDYQPYPAGSQAYFDAIEDACSAPIVLTSYGPTADDKQLRGEFR